jgi:arylformamidase
MNALDNTARRWIDVTVPIRPGMQVFPGDPPFRVELVKSIGRDGEVCNLSRIDMGAHTGTHVDAPLHFIAGASGAEAVPLDALIGPAWVVDATHLSEEIDEAALSRLTIPDGEARLLFKTPNSRLWDREGFAGDFIGLTDGAARALVEHGIRLVGADYLSIAPFGRAAPTHRAFLEAGVVIVEGLDLRDVPPGPYELLCLPLRIAGCDGAPARALVRPRRAI